MKPTNEKLAADILSAGKKEFLEKHSIHNRVKLKMIESINKKNIELKELSK